MSLVRALVASLALAAGAATSGCATKNCDVHEVEDSAESELLYTEPLAARDARAARLQKGGDAHVLLDADRARGTARVVDEPRRFDDHVSASARDGRETIVVDSAVRTSFDVEGIRVWLTVSSFTLTLDRPSRDGRLPLTELHATICERVRQPTGGARTSESMLEVCADAAGHVDFASSQGSAFDADLVLESAQVEPGSPSLRGTARLHHAPFVRRDTCLDLGGGGGIFSP